MAKTTEFRFLEQIILHEDKVLHTKKILEQRTNSSLFKGYWHKVPMEQEVIRLLDKEDLKYYKEVY